MPVIAIVSQKGGSGKTTIALHLAASAVHAQKPACVIDTDPQATAAAWGDWRGDFLPVVVTSPPARLAKTIDNARKEVEVVVIDTPPHAEAAMREAIKGADIVLIPSRPRAFDLHALEAVADLVNYAEKPAFVVLNAVLRRDTSGRGRYRHRQRNGAGNLPDYLWRKGGFPSFFCQGRSRRRSRRRR